LSLRSKNTSFLIQYCGPFFHYLMPLVALCSSGYTYEVFFKVLSYFEFFFQWVKLWAVVKFWKKKGSFKKKIFSKDLITLTLGCILFLKSASSCIKEQKSLKIRKKDFFVVIASFFGIFNNYLLISYWHPKKPRLWYKPELRWSCHLLNQILFF
jgi:hypothetical protein